MDIPSILRFAHDNGIADAGILARETGLDMGLCESLLRYGA